MNNEQVPDLIEETLIMEDASIDIDLLDELLLQADWNNTALDNIDSIEPSFVNGLMDTSEDVNSSNSTYFGGANVSLNALNAVSSSPTPMMMPPSPIHSIPSPQEFKPVPELLQMSTPIHQLTTIAPTTTTAVLTALQPITNNIHTNSNVSQINIAPHPHSMDKSGGDKKLLPQPHSQHQMQQIFSIPVYTNQILVPQLSLQLMDSDSKLPVKRLTNEKQPKKKETTRRSSHNAIERRYRSSINDKIVELKSLVCPSDGNDKVHKAAILKSSIDTIRTLKGHNQRLEKENKYLKQNSKCPNCGYTNENTGNSVRELLQGPNTPPLTSSESSDSSQPSSPQSSRGSPLALFGLAAGIFLLNPIPSTHHEIHEGRSRIERSVDSGFEPLKSPTWLDIWTPRILALAFNLILFMIIYYLTGKIGAKRKPAKKSNYGHKLIQEVSSLYKNAMEKPEKEKKKDLKEILEKSGYKWGRIRFFHTYWVGFRAILKIFTNKSVSEQDQDYCRILAKTWFEIGKINKKIAVYAGMRSVIYAIDAGVSANDLLLAACVLAKSRLFLRLAMFRLKNSSSSHALLSKTGLPFLLTNINVNSSTPNQLTSCINEKDPLSTLLHKYKEEMLERGISSLFDSGFNSSLYFKGAMNAVLNERGSKVKDFNCEWWSGILWSESEWIFGGRRKPILSRLYTLVDSLWANSNQQEDSLSKAVYYCHMAKRIIFDGNLKEEHTNAKRLIDNASSSLKDSINLSTDKPRQSIQLLWALAAEWILEVRLAIWDETGDSSCSIPFQKDLDTLRSMTHYIPQCLSTVFLYEASLRLMSGASPGRTQHLLDACLRNARINQKTGLICAESDNCANKRNGFDGNLVREKRKATALYLRCKFLPSLVVSCHEGEKVGLLREAIKALEKIGDKKKIKECLELMKRSEASLVY